MKTTWFGIVVLTLLSLGSLVALSIDAPVKKPSTDAPPIPAATAPTAPAATVPAPASDSRVDEPTDADRKDPDGGFLPAPQSDKAMELPPEMRGTADFDISFPIDI
jgi:hypothetical protein